MYCSLNTLIGKLRGGEEDEYTRYRDVDCYGFQVHRGIAAHCHCGWLRCWFCNSISLRRKALEQQGTFNFNAQVGVNFVYSGISCPAAQVDTPAD